MSNRKYRALKALDNPVVHEEIGKEIDAAVFRHEMFLMERLHDLGYPVTVNEQGYAIDGVNLY